MPTVLVVHDDSTARASIAQVLRSSGVDVYEAGTLVDVIPIAHEQSARFILVFTRAGGLDALEAATALQGLAVHIPWMLVSVDPSSAIDLEPPAIHARPTGGDIAAILAGVLGSEPTRHASWPLLPFRLRLAEPASTASRAAYWVLMACDAQVDVPTLDEWRRLAGTSYTRLRDAFSALNIAPSDARDLMRLLRALVRCGGRLHGVTAELAFGDPRTTKALLQRAGLLDLHPAKTITFEDFLARQRFVHSSSQLVAGLRSLVAGLEIRRFSSDLGTLGGGGGGQGKPR
jgi:CheY-like chemotaxis protein